MIPFVDLKPYVDLVMTHTTRSDDTSSFQGDFEHHLNTVIWPHHEFIGGGPTTQHFEAALAKKLSAQHVIACANGTDALQLALRACGIERGHRVAMPNITFWATFEAIVNVGATPILLDINDVDYQLDFDEIVRAHRARPLSAVVLPHLFGWCSERLSEIRVFCRDRHITLIEDGAQAFGVMYDGTSVFQDADVATLSFYPAKVIGGIGDGGAVLTKSPRIAAKVRALANHGRSAHFEHAVVGWNSRMDAIQAAWLLRALDVADKVIEERRRLVRLYGGPRTDHTMVHPANSLGNGYLALNMIRGDVTKAHSASFSLTYRVQERLHDIGIEGRRLYPITIDKQPGAAGHCIPIGMMPVSREFAERAFCLPLWYGMTDEQVERCATAFEAVARR
jgi:UDP-2-acetamido-2-deoxy-ribo-hexuluronate aminotransferase